jgi:Flp pilus assembly protein TadD
LTRDKRKPPSPGRSRQGRGDAAQPGAEPSGVAPQAAAGLRRPRRLPIWWAGVVALVLVLFVAVLPHVPTGPPPAPLEGPGFVGSDTCAACHRSQADLWRPSQHRLAMQHATEQTVLGNFNDARFEHAGVRSRFFRQGGRFLVETDGADGKLAVFDIRYTFGLDPLQQYLVEFADGRLQALSIAWDSRPAARGGQRWFHLYAGETVRHDDELHWTRPSQNWNFMCAECHSMGVRKNYDAERDRFATTWAEISVGCESCHGQGSHHVDWARDRQGWWPFGRRDDPDMGLLARYGERRDVTWAADAATGNAVRSRPPAALRTEVETCGLCHGRRGQQSEAWVPGRSLSDTHAVSPLSRGLYHADGQMLDEVYNYGSFRQSKMYAAGVTCSDCHEPHSTKLRAGADGVCLQCHLPDRYAAASHHHHERSEPKPTCASCHMPTRTYMVVDPRHDHGFRIPRPDLSQKIGTPNACNACHSDRPAEWAAGAIERWFGPQRKGFQTYAEALHAAWQGGADAARLLAAIASDPRVPAIARASALAELAPHLSRDTLGLARAGLADAEPMVRIAAIDMLEGAPPARAWPLVAPLLTDPVGGVRLRAVALLAAVPTAEQPGPDRDRFARAAAEFVAAQRLNADRPEARTNLGAFLARQSRAPEAEAEFRAALRLSPTFAPAAVNLADLYRQLGRDADGEEILRAALQVSPRNAALHHALGLVLVRLKQEDAALAELGMASQLEPGHERYAYVHAVALHSSGRRGDALTLMKATLTRHPGSREVLSALIGFSRDAGDPTSALAYATRLQQLAPDPELARLIEDLRSQPLRQGTR